MKKLVLMLIATAVAFALATPAFAKSHKKHNKKHHHHQTTQPSH